MRRTFSSGNLRTNISVVDKLAKKKLKVKPKKKSIHWPLS